MVPAVGIRRNQLHRQRDLRSVRRIGIVDRRLLLSEMAGSIGFEDNTGRACRDRKSPRVRGAHQSSGTRSSEFACPGERDLLAGLRRARVFRELPNAGPALRVSLEGRSRVRAIVVFAQRSPLFRPVGFVRIQVNLIPVPVAVAEGLEWRKILTKESTVAHSPVRLPARVSASTGDAACGTSGACMAGALSAPSECGACDRERDSRKHCQGD